MKTKFIELTNMDDEKFLINTFYIAMIESVKTGSKLTLNLEHSSFPKKVKETMSQIRSMLEE